MRLAGKAGAVYVQNDALAFIKVLDTAEWSWNAECEMDEITIKGDRLRQFTPGQQIATFSAKRYHEGTQVFQGYVSEAAQLGKLRTWRLDLVDNDGGFTQITCSGFGKSSTTGAPITGGVQETFTLQVSDTYSFSV